MEGLPAYWEDLAVQHSINAAATASIFMNYDLDKPRMVSHVIPVAGVIFQSQFTIYLCLYSRRIVKHNPFNYGVP